MVVNQIQGRQRRQAANLNYNFNEDKMFYQFFNKPHKKEDKNYEPKQKKDKSVKLSKLYEFQFYDNYEELQELSNEIQTMQDTFQTIPEELKEKFKALLQTGFYEWTIREYQAFIKGIRKNQMSDIEAIAKEVETKTAAEVEDYMKVFMVRFRELKEKDLVLQKLQKKDFELKNLETIRDFDVTKDYAMLLQENNYFNRTSYLAMMERAHNKLVGSGEPLKHGKDLQLKIDNFFHS